MKHVDYTIAGGGCAGLSLVYYMLNHHELQHKSILVIDKNTKKENDKTWCFWTDQPTDFDSIVFKKWKSVEILDDTTHLVRSLHEFTYQMIRSQDFYQHIHQKIAHHPNVQCIIGEIEHITNQPDCVHVTINHGTKTETFTSEYVFDSCFSGNLLNTDQTYHHLLQHFTGWFIKTPTPFFDPEKMTMFDFRVEQNKDLRFVYILPITDSSALVEYTIFSDHLLPSKTYDQALRNYINNVLKISDYTIEETEQGVIPMTDFTFEKQTENRILNIGTKGGACKPSTGYAFLRIQEESKNIVHSLSTQKTPFFLPKTPFRYQFYDSMLLNIMQEKESSMQQIFMKLFENNPIERVFRFLNESTSFAEDLKIMSSVPPVPFLKSIKNILYTKLR